VPEGWGEVGAADVAAAAVEDYAWVEFWMGGFLGWRRHGSGAFGSAVRRGVETTCWSLGSGLIYGDRGLMYLVRRYLLSCLVFSKRCVA
jgi:hypothetical protein